MNRTGGSPCLGGIFFLHRATGVHELRQQYALSGRRVFRLNQAGTCADAARAHKRVDTYGFHPLVNHPFPLASLAQTRDRRPLRKGERQRIFSTVGAHSVRPCLCLYAVSDSLLLHIRVHLRRRNITVLRNDFTGLLCMAPLELTGRRASACRARPVTAYRFADRVHRIDGAE